MLACACDCYAGTLVSQRIRVPKFQAVHTRIRRRVELLCLGNAEMDENYLF